MRRVILSFAGCGALYGAAAWMFALPPFEQAPTFYQSISANGQSYACNAGVGPSIHVRFEEKGRVAVVRAADKILRLRYRGSDFIDDVYEDGPWRLTLDPEVNLTGPGFVGFGNCA